MKIRWIPMALVVASFTASLASGQGFTERGAAVGGIAGALTGAAIGKHNNKTGVGALVGGAVGLATGAAIGSAQDTEMARARVQQQHYYNAQVSRAVSTYDVVAMTQSGVGDHVIISHIHQNGVQRRLEVADVIGLHQQGVSEAVINALQNASFGAPAPVGVTRPAPVIVEEYYHPRPVYIHRPAYYPPRHHYHRHYHGGVSGRLSIGF